MRIPVPVVAAALVLAALLVQPLAGAATFDVEGGKIFEKGLEPGADIRFEIPLEVHQAGHLYAKVLPTPGNAVNDGTGPNGSVERASGWRVSFAMERQDGTLLELGTFVDSTMTQLVPVDQGERLAFLATVHAPANAAEGGPRQRVYVALAYRLDAGGAGPGSASGATMDEARALTLLLTNELLPEPVPGAVGAGGSTDGGGSGDGGTGSGGTTDGGGQSNGGGSAYPPVGPVPEESTTRVVVVEQQLPAWFLVVSLALLAVMAGTFLALVALVALVRRDLLAASMRADEGARQPRSIPVMDGASAARQFLAALHPSEGGRETTEAPDAAGVGGRPPRAAVRKD